MTQLSKDLLYLLASSLHNTNNKYILPFLDLLNFWLLYEIWDDVVIKSRIGAVLLKFFFWLDFEIGIYVGPFIM